MLRHRPLALLVAALAVAGLAACSDDDDPPSASDGVVDPDADLPSGLTTFLDDVTPAGETPFQATYEVLQKLGGAPQQVRVEADPPHWRITAGDAVLVGGPEPATCSLSAGTCRAGLREEVLSPVGVFSGFYSSAPARQLETAARRAGADEPTFADRVQAGVTLRSATLPSAPLTACLTAEGVFGLVDDAARRVALTDYVTEPPAGGVAPPFPVTP